jgi:hypothetical protein
MRNVSNNRSRENQNTHFMSSNYISKIVPFMRCRIMLQSWAKLGKQQMTIWCMSIACWITKATNTHSKYVIITACPRKQW